MQYLLFEIPAPAPQTLLPALKGRLKESRGPRFWSHISDDWVNSTISPPPQVLTH